MGLTTVLSKDNEELWRPAAAATALQHIVVAVDASDAARGAIALGARLGASFGSRIHLVHVVDLGHGPPAGTVDETRVAKAFDFAQTRLAEERAVIRSPIAPAIAEVRPGRPASAIDAFAREVGAELIVVGTRHRPGTHRLGEDGTAGEIIQRAHVPVLVVHEHWKPGGPGEHAFRAPLVAVDYGDASTAAFRSAIVLARGAEVHVVHAIADDVSWHVSDGRLRALHARARAMAAARERLEQWIGTKVASAGARVRPFIAVGSPATAVVDVAVGGGFDLVTCGTHAPSAPASVVLGSVAEALLDAVTCPVLVLREARTPVTSAPPATRR